MKILISNDDGIHAEGIRVLSEFLARKDENEVWVVAPDRERSATGHSLTLHKPLRVKKVTPPGNVKGAWSTSGTPSDCVKLAIMEILDSPPDLVISGINRGSNLGSELLYSGTVAAAMEGAFLNIPSIAVSQMTTSEMEIHYDTAAQFVQKLLDAYPKAHLSKRSLLNVNIPNVKWSELQGCAITELGVRLYDDRFEKRKDPRGGDYYWLTGQALDTDEAENSDVWAVLNKMASVTPISFNMTDRKTLEGLSNLQELKDIGNHQKVAHLTAADAKKLNEPAG